MDQPRFNEKEIIVRFKEAVVTLRRLPPVKARGYFNSWPDIIYSEKEIMRMDQKTRNRKATPEAISRMEKTISWLDLLENTQDRKIIWMRAENIPWEIICKKFTISRSYAFRKWQNALATICALYHL